MKVLLLDTAFGAAPIYDALEELNHEVWVMGNRPHDVLAKRAGERWIDQSYSDADAVLKYAEKHRIDRVLPGCTDVSIDAASKLPAGLYLGDSQDVNTSMADKSHFRKHCEALRLPAPKQVRADQFPIPGQYICKPVDAFSGRGISIFDGEDTAAFHAACKKASTASPSGSFLIETYALGQLYSCSAFLVGHKINKAFYVREGSSANPYAVDTSYVDDDVPAPCQKKVEGSIEILSSQLGLKDGLFHLQFILSGNEPFIIEVTRRCPGDLYSLLIEYSTAYEYAKQYASHYIGEPYACNKAEKKYVLRHTVTSTANTVYQGLNFNRPITVKAFFPLLHSGQDMLAMQGNRAGVLFSVSSSHAELQDQYDLFLHRHAYSVGPKNQ